jgi:hypothetical protein
MAGADQTVPMAQLGDSIKPIPMQLAMGGSLPGAVGFTYARTAGAAPSNGPYAKKTKASAQNGQEMKYYQEGLDFKPKTISQDGSDIPVDSDGYWNPENWGNPVIIPSTDITMEGVDVPLIGISDTGDVQYMEPGEDYEFDGEYVTEYPVAQKGEKIYSSKDIKAKPPYNYPEGDPRSHGLFNRYVDKREPKLPRRRFPSMEVEDVDLSYKLPEPKTPTAPKIKGLISEEPTNYSYTYQSPSGEQKSIYFPTKSAWKAFVDQYDGLNTQETSKGASASPGVYSQQRRPSPAFKDIKFKNGGVSVNDADAQPIEKLDQLLNFTNYNKPTKGGWLDKYN